MRRCVPYFPSCQIGPYTVLKNRRTRETQVEEGAGVYVPQQHLPLKSIRYVFTSSPREWAFSAPDRQERKD